MDEKLALMGHMIPLKTATIEDALDRATIRLGIYTVIATSSLA